METIFIYFLKSSGLLTAFYLAYYFFLKKETFFTSNRWFLILGLFTSALLPLLTFEKIEIIETTQDNIIQTLTSNNQLVTKSPMTNEIVIDWYSVVFWIYIGIAAMLLFKIIFEFFQVFKTLNGKKITKKEKYNYIDIDEVVAPFSFFKYIVFNSKLYSNEELASILEHEKVHSSQVHSMDVLVASIFQVVFWFNPLLFIYKKSIIQNLEFIADSQAIKQFEDKKRYQMTLLKVVTYQNYLPITNHFYQSLIKKRIVMLNKNQSKKVNVWKYSIIFPALVAFIMLFQVTVVAQEKIIKVKEKDGTITLATAIITERNFDKNSSQKNLDEATALFKKEQNVDLKFYNIKRNNKGEILEISANFKTNTGTNGNKVISSDEPIKPFTFYSKTFANGKMDVGFKVDKNTDIPNPPMPASFKNSANPPLPPSPPKLPMKNKKQVYKLTGKENKEQNLAIDESKRVIEESKIEIVKSRKEIAESRLQVAEAKKQFEESRKEIEESKIQVIEAKKQFLESKKEIEESKKQVAVSRKKNDETKHQVDDAKKQIDENKDALIRERIKLASEKNQKI